MTKNAISRVFTDEVGATAVEYGIMLVAIAGAVVAVVYAIGGSVKGLFETTESNMSANGM